MFRRWLLSLLPRPRLSEADIAAQVDDCVVSRGAESQSDAFQPIRSQEEIQQEEEDVRTRKTSVMARFFDERGV